GVPQHVQGLAVLVGEIWNDTSGLSAGSSRSRSTTAPSTLAATAAWARRLPMPSATSRGRVPGAAGLVEPSGSLSMTMTETPAKVRPAARPYNGPAPVSGQPGR